MKRVACKYSIVQFMPYPETSEFANIGIVLACPSTGYFNFKIQTKKYARYTHFFRDLDRNVYIKISTAIKDEIQWAIDLSLQNSSAENIRYIFSELVKPREAIVRFSEERAYFAEEPQKTLDDLYSFYIDQDFVTPEYKEKTLERNIQNLLNRLNLKHPFRKERVGDDDFYMNFPLVQKMDNKIIKVIKPIHLGQSESKKVYDHADNVLGKIRRLKKSGHMPTELLFTLQGPDKDEESITKAFNSVCEEIEEIAPFVFYNDKKDIIDFARKDI